MKLSQLKVFFVFCMLKSLNKDYLIKVILVKKIAVFVSKI